MNQAKYSKEFNEMIPKIFFIETVVGCDLKCPECAVGGDIISRKKGWMRFDEFKKIADKIRPYCKYLYLHLWGEPLLNKDIFKIIQYASTFTETNISTNGNSLTEEKAEKLIKSGVTDIIVSIDGMTQDIYENYRVKGSVDKALLSLKMLVELSHKYGNKNRFNPQYIVFKHNQHEMDSFSEYCRLLGLKPNFKAPYIRSNSRLKNSTLSEYIRPFYPDVAALRQVISSHCINPKEVFTIHLDGSCVMCCHDHNGISNYGNIFNQDVLEIWNSAKYKKDRWDIIKGNAPEYCIETCMEWRLDNSVRNSIPITGEKNIFQNKNSNLNITENTETNIIPEDGSIPENRSKEKKNGCRLIPCHDISDFHKGLENARKSFQNGKYNEAFDIYLQLSIAFQNQSIEILAEAYDQYQHLPVKDRYILYQSRFYDFGIQPTDKVLDIGSGNTPFHLATHLADIAVNDNNYGRAGEPFKYIKGKPVFELNIEQMPFENKEFDFVYCSHVLEHVANPEKACDELMRIAKRGFIDTPTRGKDLWMNSAKISNHRWAVDKINNKLIFTEYTSEEIEGLQNFILLNMHCVPQTVREKAFSALVYLKGNLLNTMLLWENFFKYEVHRLKKEDELKDLVQAYDCDLNIELAVIKQLNLKNNHEALSLLEQKSLKSSKLVGNDYGKAIALVRLGKIHEASETLKHLLDVMPEHKKAGLLLDEINF